MRLMNTFSSDALYLSVNEAIARAGCGRTTFYRLIRTGRLRGVKKLGRSTLVPVDGLRAALESLPEIGGQADAPR